MTKMAAMTIYGKKHKKYSSLEPVDRFQRNLVCRLWPIIMITVYINHVLGLTMTYFTARSFGLHRLFNDKAVKTLNFSGSFVACDLKVGRYRQHAELMKCCEY